MAPSVLGIKNLLQMSIFREDRPAFLRSPRHPDLTPVDARPPRSVQYFSAAA